MIDLRYALHGGAIALVWFGMINVAAAAVVLLVAHRAGRRAAASGPTFWLSLRLLPAVASIAFVGLLFVPSYWAYEPRAVEDLDVTLAIAACATLVLFAAAATRASGAWHRAARRSRMWLRAARPLDVGSAIPTYEVPIEAPMMALVGVFRPRLVVTRGVVDALTADELRAAVAHEIGHLRAADNLKRLAIAAAPDVIGLARAGSAIETRWASAAEHAADRAAGGDSDLRCALASALVKVARLTPRPTPLAEPISTLVDGGDIASRVRSLLDDDPQRPPRLPASRLAMALAAGAAFVIAYAPLLRMVHEATEVIVNTLP